MPAIPLHVKCNTAVLPSLDVHDPCSRGISVRHRASDDEDVAHSTRADGTCPRVRHHELTARALAAAQYTFRNEHIFFADNFKTINDEYQAALDAGVDGLFSDYIEGAYQACTASSQGVGE